MRLKPQFLRGWILACLAAAFWLLTAPASRADISDIIPPDRMITWSRDTVGVPGGIVYRTNIFCNVRVRIPGTNIVAVADGVTDDSPALQAALNLCPSGQVIYIPAGVYECNEGLSIKTSCVTIRGDGMGKTVLNVGCTNATTAFLTVGQYASSSLFTNTSTVSGATKGSTNIGVTCSAPLFAQWFKTNSLIMISESNPNFMYKLPPIDNLARYIGKVNSINGTNVTVWPPIYFDFTNNPCMAFTYLYLTTYTGVEDLSVMGLNNVGIHIFMEQTYGCWLRDVESWMGGMAHFYVAFSTMGEIRDCYMHEGYAYGSNAGEALEMYQFNSGFLVENNVFHLIYPAVNTSSSSSANVIAYNYSRDVPSGNVMGCDFDGNHGPHTMMNLWEGNVAAKFQSDSYFGSASHQTLFRNYFAGATTNSSQLCIAIDLCRFTQDMNIIGNVLGTNGWRGGYDEETNNYSLIYNVIYRLGYPGMGGNSYTGTNYGSNTMALCGSNWVYTMDNKGFLDYNVKQTIIRHGNYDYASKSTIWDPTIADTNLPPSLFYTSKPTWWSNNVPWPPIGPDCTPLVSAIPAQLRYNSELVSLPVPLLPPTNLRIVSQ